MGFFLVFEFRFGCRMKPRFVASVLLCSLHTASMSVCVCVWSLVWASRGRTVSLFMERLVCLWEIY